MDFKNLKKILCFGEVLWDNLPTGAKPGGAPLNVSIHMKTLGLNPIIVSKIGNDKKGSALLSFIRKAGVSIELIQHDDNLPTSTVEVHLDGDNNATFEICEPVAWDNIIFTPELNQLSRETDAIVFGSLASRNETTYSTLKKLLNERELFKILDVNLRPPHDSKKRIEKLLFFSDMVKLNDDELHTITGWHDITGDDNTQVSWISEHYNCPVVCVTRGANGALLYYEKKYYSHPGFVVKTKDTVGAGDAFLAGMISCLVRGKNPDNALEFACATGAYVASKSGAVPNYVEGTIFAKIINANQNQG